MEPDVAAGLESVELDAGRSASVVTCRSRCWKLGGSSISKVGSDSVPGSVGDAGRPTAGVTCELAAELPANPTACTFEFAEAPTVVPRAALTPSGEDELAAGDALLPEAGVTEVSTPGNSLSDADETTVPPSRPSKRATRLSWTLGPPTLSHGIQTLYEWPILVLL